MRAAFFDFDRTLIVLNSALPFLMSEWRAGIITWRTVLEAMGWVAQYKLGKADMENALGKSMAMMDGHREADLRARTIRFYAEHLKDRYRPGARAALNWHRECGDKVVLLSTASTYLAECIAEDLGLDDVLCTSFEVNERGVFTGRASAFAYGEGKLRLAKDWTEAEGIEASACAFYTDSYTDWPVMEWVGRPVAVNPDFRLKRLSQRRGWEIVDWGKPARA